MSVFRRISRRRALQALGAAASAPMFVPGHVLGANGATPPSEKIVMATIGSGGMGRGNTGGMMRYDDCQYVAICDVDDGMRAKGVELVNKRYNNSDCKEYKDFREVLGRDDIDAVVIATPDHWHALITIAAAQAKKAIYCQKPITHTFAEGIAMTKAVKDSGVIFQVGSQQRSSYQFRAAAELVRNGVLGKIKMVEIGLPTGHKKLNGSGEATDPPANTDYDFWVGPAPKLPFVPARYHFHWRWSLAFGGGQLMDWIGHHNDCTHWALDRDNSGPIEVKAQGFDYAPDDVRAIYNSAVNYDVRCKYDDGVETSISNAYPNGIKFIGENGWVFVSRSKYEASEKAWVDKKFDAGPIKVYNSPEHHRNFLDGVKTGKAPICPAETGHRSVTPGHLGLLSESLGGRTLKWDPVNQQVVGDDEANRLLHTAELRAPWSLPA
ncbi:MAG: gfo/Idh/MocA family oxidoreductase [Phycisphaera sp.]|nr:gfo/Idh/MocA family oxidoreductase [Phycisphaera sp.]